MEERIKGLKKIYAAFAEDTDALRGGAACARGCSFCCEAAGIIEITTLEGLEIRRAMEKMPKPRQASLTKAFRKEIRQREAGRTVPCPFLMKNRACMIYEIRPFSCRRIYSVHTCGPDHPPALSRQVMETGNKAIKAIQALDANGYCGHLSYILYMLSVPAFLDTYLSGGFKPEEIMDFGKTHKIGINKMLAG